MELALVNDLDIQRRVTVTRRREKAEKRRNLAYQPFHIDISGSGGFGRNLANRYHAVAMQTFGAVRFPMLNGSPGKLYR
ncbi:hypothetical protein OS31_10500 [Dickeya oryzae]